MLFETLSVCYQKSRAGLPTGNVSEDPKYPLLKNASIIRSGITAEDVKNISNYRPGT